MGGGEEGGEGEGIGNLCLIFNFFAKIILTFVVIFIRVVNCPNLGGRGRRGQRRLEGTGLN